MTAPISIVVVSTALPGQGNALRDAQKTLVAETLREPGCLRYELHQSVEDADVLMFIESWESEEALQTHLQGPAVTRFRASNAASLRKDFKFYRMKPVAAD